MDAHAHARAHRVTNCFSAAPGFNCLWSHRDDIIKHTIVYKCVCGRRPQREEFTVISSTFRQFFSLDIDDVDILLLYTTERGWPVCTCAGELHLRHLESSRRQRCYTFCPGDLSCGWRSRTTVCFLDASQPPSLRRRFVCTVNVKSSS